MFERLATKQNFAKQAEFTEHFLELNQQNNYCLMQAKMLDEQCFATLPTGQNILLNKKSFKRMTNNVWSFGQGLIVSLLECALGQCSHLYRHARIA